jgi:AraC-like DNA-binding protein
MSTTKQTSDFKPLLKALHSIESRLESRGESGVLVARKTQKVFERQKLASHNKVTARQLRGARNVIRGRRRIDQTRIIAARWPEDKMLETTEPTINFILSGQADMRVANYVVHCGPGDAILIPAGMPTSDGSLPNYVDVTPQSACDVLLLSPGLAAKLGLECEISHSRGEKHLAGNVDERCWMKNLPVAQLYFMLCAELENRGNSKSTFHLLMLLLIQLQQEIKAGNAMVGWPFSTSSVPDIKQELIHHAIKYINEHLGEPLTIDVVAREMGVSRSILTREFRRAAKDTFKNYLTKQRMKLAEVLLKEANLPVSTVSKRVGLSPDRLRVLFQQKYQCSPDEFRHT